MGLLVRNSLSSCFSCKSLSFSFNYIKYFLLASLTSWYRLPRETAVFEFACLSTCPTVSSNCMQSRSDRILSEKWLINCESTKSVLLSELKLKPTDLLAHSRIPHTFSVVVLLHCRLKICMPSTIKFFAQPCKCIDIKC